MSFVFLLILALLSGNAWAGLTRAAPSYVEGEVLVVPASPAAVQNVRALGLTVAREYRGKTRFLRLKLKLGQRVAEVMSTLSARPWVAHVQPNYLYRMAAAPNDPRFAEYWGLQNTGQTVNGQAGSSGADISAVSAWDEISDCSSVVVAVIDSGVDYSHPDLAANIWNNPGEVIDGIDNDGNGFIDDVRGWDFVQADNDPMDFNSHGTHVAGTLGAVGNNGIGGTGVCWNARVMPLRVLNSVGVGTTADIVAAIDYAAANGARILNMSFGGPDGVAGDLMDMAIANAAVQGVLVVAAAGNEGADNDLLPSYPASYARPNIIAVAATDQQDSLAAFSNFGQISVDVAAPGTNILSGVPPARVPVCSWNFDTGTLEGWIPETIDRITGLPVANTVAVTGETFASPAFSLTDTPGVFYANNRSYRASSPVCNLGGKQGVVLSYRLNLATESGFDFLWVDGTADGVTWTMRDGWTGKSGGWVPTPFESDMQMLDGIATAQVRFRFDSDFSVTFDGFHVDDVSLTVPGTVHGPNAYAFGQGTSMATPHVAGLAALIWAAEPGLGLAQLKQRILNNGDQVPSLAGKTVTGRRINARMSMPLHAPAGLTATASGPTTVVLAWLDQSVSEVDQIIQRDTGAGFTTLTVLPANAVSYTDPAAPSGATIRYRVIARGRDGRMATGTTVSVATPVPPPAGGGGGCLIPGTGQWNWMLVLTAIWLTVLACVCRRVNRHPS
jgi:subtilisin family serine protease